jgi:hypothetical protein
MLVTGLSGAGNTIWAVTRGIEGTSAAAHSSGATVVTVLTAAAMSGLVDPQTNDLRLTLQSGVAVPTTDQTGQTTIYLTPKSNIGGTVAGAARIAIYDGTLHRLYATAEISLALGTLINAQAYDVFVYDNAGAPTLELQEWQNATVTMTIATPCVVTWTSHGLATGTSVTFTTSGALPTGLSANTPYYITVVDANTFKLSTSLANLAAGTFVSTSGSQSGTHTGHSPTARAVALDLQDGVLYKHGALTRRYLGTFCTTSTTTTEDSFARRYLWNCYHKAKRPLRIRETTSSWTYNSATYRQANGNTANQVEVVIGLPGLPVELLAVMQTFNTTNGYGAPGIGEDSTTVNSVDLQTAGPYAGQFSGIMTTRISFPPVGRHFYLWLEAANVGTVSFFSNNNDLAWSGLYGHLWC